jgi:Kef-type K+ transport system membrane component KefB
VWSPHGPCRNHYLPDPGSARKPEIFATARFPSFSTQSVDSSRLECALAPTFLAEHELPHRMRIIAFSILTPFYFLKAGSLVEVHAVIASLGLIAVFLAVKMATKFIGILPLAVYHEFDRREGMYTTLLMSTGLTFGSISALFGLTNKIIDQTQYTILLTAVIGSAVVPTLIAQAWFQPDFKAIANEPEVMEAEESASEEP